MNLTTITDRAAKFASDPDQTRFGGRYTDAVNDAQKQFALDSGALFKDKTYTSAADDATYDLPTDFIVEDFVLFDGLPLKPTSRRTLNTLYPGTDWANLPSATPTAFMVDPEIAVMALRLVPAPNAVKTISMRYMCLPADVSAGVDVPLNASTLMTQFHLGIAAFAAFLVLSGETSTPEIRDKKSDLMRLYQEAVNKAIEKFGNTKSESLRIRPKC